jgi:hypothetical protein
VNLWLEEPRPRVRCKPASRFRVCASSCGSGLERAVSLGNAGSLHDSGIPNLKLNNAMKDLLAGSRTNRLPSDPVA